MIAYTSMIVYGVVYVVLTEVSHPPEGRGFIDHFILDYILYTVV